MKRHMQACFATAILAGLFAFAGGVIAQPIGVFMPPHAFADTPVNEACTGIGLTGTNNGTCGDQGVQLNNIIKTGLEILSVVIGIAAVVMIMVAGLRLVLAGGDSGKVAGAKNSIIYAIIGLVIVVAAQAIVQFVLSKTS